MYTIFVFATVFIIPSVTTSRKLEIKWTYFKRQYICNSAKSRSHSLRKESIGDLLTCSLLCQKEINCSSFFFNVTSLACILQGNVLEQRSFEKCRAVWCIRSGDKQFKNGAIQDRALHGNTTKPSVPQHASTTAILATSTLTPFKHDKNITLHQACEEGNLNEVKYILSNGLEDINCRDKDGRTPVMSAVAMGQEAVFDFLLRHGCNLSAVSDHNNSVLHMACHSGNTDIVRKLLDGKKLDMDSRGGAGRTPVMFAAYKGNRKVVEMLVDRGCNVTVVDKYTDNILHVACGGGHADVVKYIITESLVSLETRGHGGKTPVMTAALFGHLAVTKLLILHGCDTRITDHETNNVLHAACYSGQKDTVQYVLKQNVVGIDSRGRDGITPVMIAAVGGHKEVFDLLVREGCNPRLVNDPKNNIIHAACIGGHVDMVQHILKQNIVSLNTKNSRGKSPVMIAALKGHLGVYNLLVDEGCNLKAVDVYKSNILHSACVGGNVDIVKDVLNKHIIDINRRGRNGETPLMVTTLMGNIEVFDILVSGGCNLKLAADNGNDLLHIACVGGHVDMVHHIMKLNLFDINRRGCYGRTAALIAASYGHTDVVDLLKTKGGNLRLVETYNNNILHIASHSGHVDMVKYILNLNIIDINSRGFYGKTAVLLAAEKGHIEVVKLLVLKGCSLMKVDNNRNTILHGACRSGHVDLVKYILSKHIFNVNIRNSVRVTPVMMAALKGHVEVFDILRLTGCNLRLVDISKNNILHHACIGGHVDMVRHIIKLDMLDINSRGCHRRTPVLLAAQHGHLEVFNLLIQKDCSVTIVSDLGNNLLHFSCYGGHTDIVKYALKLDPVMKRQINKSGMTPMKVAESRGHWKAVNLLEAGTN